MAFQKSVAFAYAAGMAGEAAADAPRVSRVHRLDETAGKVHKVGLVYTYLKDSTDGKTIIVTPGGAATKLFAGILAAPKHYALLGTANEPLAASMALEGGSEAEFVTEGNLFVEVEGAVAYGDPVKFTAATGVIAKAGDVILDGAYYAQTTTKAGLVRIQLNGGVSLKAVTP